MSLATLSVMGLMFCVFANKPHVCCLSNHEYMTHFLYFSVSNLYRPLLIEHIVPDIGG